MWDELGIAPSDDPKVIRRAYAARLKKIDPDRDPDAFRRLREALEWALAEAEVSTLFPQLFEPDEPAEAAEAQDEEDELGLADWRAEPDRPDHDERAGHVDRPLPEEPAARSPGRDAEAEWIDLAAPDHALVDALDVALDRGDAAEAMRLYYRAAATGAVPLNDAPAFLNRLFAVAVEDRTIDRGAFRELARAFGWDQPAHRNEVSDLRGRVLARLAAEDWYDSLVATAERRAGTTRKQAQLARLMLGRIGRYRIPYVDHAALGTQLDHYRAHESWVRDRIDPASVERLQKAWRRRQIAGYVLLCLILAGLLIDGTAVFIAEARAGTLSLWAAAAGVSFAALLLWLLKLLWGELRRMTKQPPKQPAKQPATPPPSVSDTGPPDDPPARLRWLEQQAELAYEAMYDAPVGSSPAARYSDAKEFLYDAIGLAKRLGEVATAERLSRRLDEIKAVFRSQFS